MLHTAVSTVRHPTLGTYSLVELTADVDVVQTAESMADVTGNPGGPAEGPAGGPAGAPALVLTLIVDVSGSMSPYMQDVLNACLATVDALKDGSSLSISTFDDAVKKIVELVRVHVYAPAPFMPLPLSQPKFFSTDRDKRRQPHGHQRENSRERGEQWRKYEFGGCGAGRSGNAQCKRHFCDGRACKHGHAADLGGTDQAGAGASQLQDLHGEYAGPAVKPEG